MFSFGVCNFNNKYCGCQTCKEDENNPEKCYYCNHYNAFHTGFSPPPQNTSPPLLGVCQKDGVSCGCQAYFANPNNELKCKYCDHFTAFHKNTSPSSVPSLPSYSLSPSINKPGDSRFRDETIKNRSMAIIKRGSQNFGITINRIFLLLEVVLLTFHLVLITYYCLHKEVGKLIQLQEKILRLGLK
jgi:hypothetical protein